MLARAFEWTAAIAGVLIFVGCDGQPASVQPQPPEPPGVAVAESPEVEPAESPSIRASATASSPTPAPDEPPRLTEKMQRRIRSKLRKKHGANVLLAETAELPTADGGVVVFALYEFSRLQACASAGGGTAAARKACVEEAIDEGEWYEDYERSDYDCNRQGLVRARFGPPPAEDPEGRGGKMTLEADRALEEACRVSEVVEFDTVDVDGDGEPELAVAYSAVTPSPFSRGGGSFDAYVHIRGWYRETLEPQAEITTGSWVSDSSAWGFVSSAKVDFFDADGDGATDIRVTRYDASHPAEGALPKPCYPAPDGTPIDADACESALADEDDEYVELGVELETKVTVGRYDSKADAWLFPAKP